MRLNRLLTGALGLALFLPSTVSSQALTSPYRFIQQRQHVDAFGAYLWPSEGRLGGGPGAGAGAGLRWGIEISGPLALDLEATYAPLKRPVVDTAFAADSSHVVRGEADMNLLLAMGNIRFNLTGSRTWHNVQPFVLFGGGVAIDLSKENGADSLVARDVRFGFGTSFAGNLGAGFELFLSPRLAARVDGGVLLWKLKAPSAFITQRSSDVVPASEWERNFKMSAGLSLHF